MTQHQQLDRRRLSTVAKIDAQIAADRQHYLAAYFAGHEGEAQFWVHEIARLENLRNLLQRPDDGEF
jgi:hypothetical protein